MTDWNRRFYELALHISQWSKDPSTKVGAVIVDNDRRIIGLGYNGFPRGVDDNIERYEDKLRKYKFVVHAEANAILNANRSVEGMSLYATKFPCSECAKIIIQAGIRRIYAPPPATDGSKWAADAEWSMTMFKEAMVFMRDL